MRCRAAYDAAKRPIPTPRSWDGSQVQGQHFYGREPTPQYTNLVPSGIPGSFTATIAVPVLDPTAWVRWHDLRAIVYHT